MRGKVCLITGASSGIGKVTARELARMGAAVTLVARDRARGEAALAEVRAAATGPAPSLELCDFGSQRAIRDLASRFLATHDRLDVLVNNAGAIHGERLVTEDGLEATFAVNHLGYFLLTALLRDLLVASAPARVVNVSSEAHRRAHLDWDDLQTERGYRSFAVYGRSKLANLAFTAELARRLEGTGVTANALHPGVVATNFGASGSGPMRFLVKVVRPFLTTAEDGAATTIHLATSPEVAATTGKYFIEKREKRPSREAQDPEVARRLWLVSEQLTGLAAG